MTLPTEPVVTSAAERQREGWGDPKRGGVTWFTLFSAGLTPTAGLTAGIAEIGPGGPGNPLHRHEQAELYFIVEGTGILTIDGVETTVTPGAAAFIPGNAMHGIRNETSANLKLFYVFPTDSFEEVVYRFEE